jgi:membrane protein implicated in regulation of membrane protease activity
MLIYAALGGAGLLLLLLMMIAGGIGDHDVPLHEASFDHGDLDAHGGPSPFGIRIIASFIMFFGVGGMIGQHLAWPHPASSSLGIGLGLIGATLVYRFAWLLHSQEATSELVIGQLVSRRAQVTIAIPQNGVGEVSLMVGAEQTAQLARSADGAPIPSGGEVVIKGIAGSQLIVQQKKPTLETVSREEE